MSAKPLRMGTDPLLRGRGRRPGVTLLGVLILFAVVGPPVGAAVTALLFGPAFLTIFIDPELAPGAVFVTYFVGAPAAVLTGAAIHLWGRPDRRLWIVALLAGAALAGFSPWLLVVIGGPGSFPPLELIWRLMVAGAVAALASTLLARLLGLLRPPPTGTPA